MSWIAVDLDNTLVKKEDGSAEDGAVEAMQRLLESGHRVSIWTARFMPMPEDRRQVLKESIENELKQLGIPYSDIWTGTTKPDADVFIGDNCINYSRAGGWPLALAQAFEMLSPPQPLPGAEEQVVE